MSNLRLQLRKLSFSEASKSASIDFVSGINVIRGASDTGKSIIAEAIDFMLGGSALREIPELNKYQNIELDITVDDQENWRIERAISGGDFRVTTINASEDSENASEDSENVSEDSENVSEDSENVSGDSKPEILKSKHAHGKTNNLSGFLLSKIGLFEKNILKSKSGTTQSFSFRNLAKLVVIQEDEIDRKGSPFWDGQFVNKTSDLAAIKLLLTGSDDSNVHSAKKVVQDYSQQIALIDEMLMELSGEIDEIEEDEQEFVDQLSRLEETIDTQKRSLNAVQEKLDSVLSQRRNSFEKIKQLAERREEITEFLVRLDLLKRHYDVDIERLQAIQETGTMFVHFEQALCPLCGALPQTQHTQNLCEGDVAAIVHAASAEIKKIERLKKELLDTVAKLKKETADLREDFLEKQEEYKKLDYIIQEGLASQVIDGQTTFSILIEKRAEVQKTLNLFTRKAKLEQRKQMLLMADEMSDTTPLNTDIPASTAHSFSQKISQILKAWNFPGECLVHFDKQAVDFVIDGKPRGSRGKGLRAITHAAVTIGLLEYCQEQDLPHPGFVVLDSPLLAYFEPEDDDEKMLSGTNLDMHFYEYLLEHHVDESQVIIIENSQPPEKVKDRLAMTVFTKNPNQGRYGFL